MAGSERSAFRRPLADRRQSGRRSLGRGKRAKRGAAKRGRRKMSASGMTRREEVRDNPSGRRSPAGVSASSSESAHRHLPRLSQETSIRTAR